jgi:hypothetical protein
VDSWYFNRNLPDIYRVFKWENGYRYISHRPPTVINEAGINLKEINFLNASKTREMGIYMFHYSFVFPKQVDEKVEYYQNSEWSKSLQTKWWANEVYYKFKHPYKAFINTHFPGWIERVEIDHPLQIQLLIKDLGESMSHIKLRQIDDLKAITGSFRYMLSCKLLKIVQPLDEIWKRYLKSGKRKIKKIFN